MTVRTVIGVLSVYLLIGLIFTFVFGIIGSQASTPFFKYGLAGNSSNYLYFSYSTLTTVGYGDLVAELQIGRSFAIIEALVGQMYLVSIVALIVGSLGRLPTSHSTPFSAAPRGAAGARTADDARLGPVGARHGERAARRRGARARLAGLGCGLARWAHRDQADLDGLLADERLPHRLRDRGRGGRLARRPHSRCRLPAVLLINTAFFHVLPSATARRPNPGLFTAVLRYLPISIWAPTWRLGTTGCSTRARVVLSVILGAAGMASVIVVLMLKKRFRYADV